MAVSWRFEIPGEPVPWRRAGVRFGARFYVDHRTGKWKRLVRGCAALAGISAPLEGPVALTLDARYASRSPPLRLHPRPPEWLTRRPDVDNLVKAVMDALNGLAWADDAQVCLLTVRKMRVSQGERARVVVAIAALETLPLTALPPPG